MNRRLALILAAVSLAAAGFVADQARQTLDILEVVERERDGWQRPDDVIRALDVASADVVVDLGSGAGYFTLKIAPLVAPEGRVLAVDLRRQSLAFLWIRAARREYSNVRIVHGSPADPKLPQEPIDAALIVNTYHELTAPAAILSALARAMRPGGRLVVVDRAPRPGADAQGGHHEISEATAERQITAHGFELVDREPAFIDRPGEQDIWWLLVLRKS